MVTTIMYSTPLEHGVLNPYSVEPQVLSKELTRSHFCPNQPLTLCPNNFPLHSSLLQVHLLRAQLKQQKLTDKIIYQSLKDQLSTC